MAKWRLAEEEKARRYYDRAVEWIEKSMPDAEQRARFRAALSRTRPPEKDATQLRRQKDK